MGQKHAYGWAWSRCNAFDREDERLRQTKAVFESLTARLRRGPVVLPVTLLSVYPDGLDGPKKSRSKSGRICRSAAPNTAPAAT